jgi:hypothetical protein
MHQQITPGTDYKGVFGRLGELRFSLLNPPFVKRCCLLDRLGPTPHCPAHTKNGREPCPRAKLKSSFATHPGRAHPAKHYSAGPVGPARPPDLHPMVSFPPPPPLKSPLPTLLLLLPPRVCGRPAPRLRLSLAAGDSGDSSSGGRPPLPPLRPATEQQEIWRCSASPATEKEEVLGLTGNREKRRSSASTAASTTRRQGVLPRQIELPGARHQEITPTPPSRLPLPPPPSHLPLHAPRIAAGTCFLDAAPRHHQRRAAKRSSGQPPVASPASLPKEGPDCFFIFFLRTFV